MVHRIRCQCFGRLAWRSQIERLHAVQTFEAISLGKAHGFKHKLSEDTVLFELLKIKIKAIYERLFDRIAPIVTVAVNPRISTMVLSKIGFLPETVVHLRPKVVIQ